MTTRVTRSTRLLVLVTFLLGSVLARQGASLSAQMAGMAGTDLTMAECRERLEKLGALLKSAGYGSARTHALSDGTLAARWYNRTSNRTALAFSGQNAVGNAFTVSEQDGVVATSELIALP
ncbi:hypothetical protein [Deinococcus aerophilus]|nr:hypothetical protein [Deinococcus aerophilus]